MAKSMLVSNLLAAVVLSAGSQSSILADDRYPGFDFEPEITYQDEAYIAASRESEETQEAEVLPEKDERYPGAYFEPIIEFQDMEYIQSGGSTGEQLELEVVVFDTTPQYPDDAAGGKAGALANSQGDEESQPSPGTQHQKNENGGFMEVLSNNPWIGFIVLAIAGFVLYTSRSGKHSSEVTSGMSSSAAQPEASSNVSNNMSDNAATSSAPARPNDGLTGVERYIRKNGMDGSLEGAGKQLPPRLEGETGVERYLRLRG